MEAATSSEALGRSQLLEVLSGYLSRNPEARRRFDQGEPRTLGQRLDLNRQVFEQCRRQGLKAPTLADLDWVRSLG